MILATMSAQMRITERDLVVLANRRSRGRIAQHALGAGPVDLWVVKVTEDGPLGVPAARALLGAQGSDARQRIDDRRRSLVARAALARLAGAPVNVIVCVALLALVVCVACVAAL